MVKVLAWVHKEQYVWGNEGLKKVYTRWLDVLMCVGVVVIAVACYSLGTFSAGGIAPEWSRIVILLGAMGGLAIICGAEGIRYSDKMQKE